MGFIKSRLNIDNFWNLMFWLGMSGGISAALSLGEINAVLGGVLFWMTIIFVPLIIKGCSEVAYIGNKVFLNSKGESLAGKYPKNLGAIIILAIIMMIVTRLTAILFLIPTLYFIYKNCPVSILFNKYAWYANSGTGFYQKGHAPSFNTNRDIYYSPLYSDISGNIYHRRK